MPIVQPNKEKPVHTQNVSEFSIEPGNTVASWKEPPSIQSIDNQLQLSPVSLSLLDASITSWAHLETLPVELNAR
jgi:hypothetical protein